MASHLDGRMPHNIVADILTKASHAKSQQEVEALTPQIEHASRIFCTILREFRATLPAQERNLGRPEIPAVPALTPAAAVDDYCPLATAFEGMEGTIVGDYPDVRVRPVTYFTAQPPRRGAYDPEHSAMNTLVVENRLQPLRHLADIGADLSTWYRQGSTVGGGFADLVRDNVRIYVWFNQLLLHEGWTPEWAVFADRYGYHSQTPMHVSAAVGRLAAEAAIEYLSPYDNHQYRQTDHGAALSRALHTDHVFNRDRIRAYIKEHIFPELVRVSHVLLYSAIRRGGAHGLTFASLTDKDARLGWFEDDVVHAFKSTMADAIMLVMPPVHGVKRADVRDVLKARD